LSKVCQTFFLIEITDLTIAYWTDLVQSLLRQVCKNTELKQKLSNTISLIPFLTEDIELWEKSQLKKEEIRPEIKLAQVVPTR